MSNDTFDRLKNTDAGAITRERILEASITLFNSQGIQRTAVYKIAEYISISAGNLNYHFKNKAQILAALAHQLDTELIATEPEILSIRGADQLIESFTTIFNMLWRYRFFFNSSPYLAAIDPSGAARFKEVHRNLRTRLGELFRHAIANGQLGKPRLPNGIQLLADNAMAVWTAWLPGDDYDYANADRVPPPGLIRECLVHHFSIIEPYLNSRTSREFQGLLELRYPLPDKTAAERAKPGRRAPRKGSAQKAGRVTPVNR